MFTFSLFGSSYAMKFSRFPLSSPAAYWPPQMPQIAVLKRRNNVSLAFNVLFEWSSPFQSAICTLRCSLNTNRHGGGFNILYQIAFTTSAKQKSQGNHPKCTNRQFGVISFYYKVYPYNSLLIVHVLYRDKLPWFKHTANGSTSCYML